LNQRWGEYLDLIDFELDRYELDNALTWNYTINTTANVDAGQAIANTVSLGTWQNPVDSGLTIVAIDVANNTISITPAAEIVDIRVGDTVSVSGNRAAVNDSNLESYVTYVGNSQGLSAYFVNQGNVVPANVIYANSYFSNANVYVSANGTPVLGYPTLQDTIVLSNAAQAGFGNASVGSNIYIVNEYVDDNRYNKYLLFPRVNIIN
jgi:hypothetical protein